MLRTSCLWAAGQPTPRLCSAPPRCSKPAAAPASQNDLSEGEIIRWDPRALKVTLRHGEIKNLDMPPMTMVFRVQDASVLGSLQPGDKVLFRAKRVSGAFHVEHIEKAP